MASSSLLHWRADQTLLKSPIPALRRLNIEESDEEVVLSGSVPSYYLKQLAQETVMPAVGSRQLRNRISVVQA
jgi:osmotically-inducible protein OsmY